MTHEHEPDVNNNELFDRLVDGELAEDERRILLLSFDREPEGWRRCALAFLEAQAWSSAFHQGVPLEQRKLSASDEFALQAATGSPASAPGRRRSFAAAVWFARAAILLTSFGLGWAGARQSTPIHSKPNLATAPAPSAPPVVKAGAAAESPSDAATEITPVSEPAHVPRTSLVSSYPLGQLERQGYRIEHRMGLMPVRSPDGRRGAIPIGAIKVRFVGHPTL